MDMRIFFVSVLGLTLLSTCRESDSRHAEDDSHAEKRVAEDVRGDKQGHSDEIVFEADKAKAAGVKVAVVRPGDFFSVTPTGGKVLPASGDETTIVATVSGVVSVNRPITEGMDIGKGVAVFTVVSSDLQEGDISQRVNITYRTAKAEYERAQRLVADKIISEKEFLAIKAEYENAQLAYEAVGKGNARGVTVHTPGAGFVKECLVGEGDYVSVGQPLMVIAQNRRLYLRAEVAERDYALLNRIVSAKFKTSYDEKIYDLEQLNGRLLSYGKTSDGASPFIPVTFEFDNTGGVIPGSYAEIYLVTGTRSNVISVPATALTEEQGVYFVYVQEDEDGYSKREVTIGRSDGERVEIVSGLQGGEKVVVEGAVHVKLASASGSIPEHTHNH